MCELPLIKIGGLFCHHCHKNPTVPGILEHTIPTIPTIPTNASMQIKIEGSCASNFLVRLRPIKPEAKLFIMDERLT